MRCVHQMQLVSATLHRLSEYSAHCWYKVIAAAADPELLTRPASCSIVPSSTSSGGSTDPGLPTDQRKRGASRSLTFKIRSASSTNATDHLGSVSTCASCPRSPHISTWPRLWRCHGHPDTTNSRSRPAKLLYTHHHFSLSPVPGLVSLIE
jgi:hypothetical protein